MYCHTVLQGRGINHSVMEDHQLTCHMPEWLETWNEQAVILAFISHQDRLLLVARRVLRRPDLAEVVVQEAVLKAAKLDAARCIASPFRFACRIVRNLAIDHGRLSCPMGEADRFLAFIEGDLKPAAEREFRADRRRQALFGHSFGGLFALCTLFMRPGSFRTYVAASPSITWGEPAISGAEALFAARDDAGGPLRLLVTVGECEQKLAPYERSAEKAAEREAYLREFRMIDKARALVDRLNALQRPGLVAEFKEYRGEGHMSLAPASMSHSLRFISAP